MRIDGIFSSPHFLVLVFLVTILHRVAAASAVCELSVTDNDNVYNYSLDSPVPDYPHGILSEDGYYKVAANGTVVWFQLCGSMIFNHDPPLCVGCKDCGGQSRCGMGCSALVSNKIEGYPVCTTLGHPATASTRVDVLGSSEVGKGWVL